MCVQKFNLGIVAKKRRSLGKTDEASQGICLESRNKNAVVWHISLVCRTRKEIKGGGK